MNAISLQQRFSAYSFFILFAWIIATAIALRFLYFMPLPSTLLAWIYVIVALCGHMFLLTLLLSIIALPCVFIASTILRRLTISIVFTIAGCILIADTIVFGLYRFHINTVVLKLFFIGNVAPIPTIVFIFLAFLISFICCIGYIALRICEIKQPLWVSKKYRRYIVTLLFLCIACSHLLHAWATAFAYRPITIATRYLPLYMPLKANSFMVRLGIIDRETIANQKSISVQDTGTLSYPRSAITTKDVTTPVNIVWIVIDSWRHDSLNPIDTPALWKFAQRGTIFTNHYSTGNATRTGIFGLFYGIPATYWHAFLDAHQAPLFITRMQELSYDIEIFSSASTTMPEFHHTVFASIPNLGEGAKGSDKVERDREITNNWLSWFKARTPNQPFFTYIFYDAVHGGGSFPEDYPKQFNTVADNINYITLGNTTDALPISNRYRTATHFVDSLVSKIIQELEQSGILDNTLVVITSDHGEEMNDNKQGYWGHNGNFTAAQTQVPLVIIAPKGKTLPNWNNFGYKTSHEDITPTILNAYLGVTSPIQDYSTGVNLFEAPTYRPLFVIASYNMYGIIGDDSIIEVSRIGTFEMRSLNNTPLPNSTPPYERIQEALRRISLFYK